MLPYSRHGCIENSYKKKIEMDLIEDKLAFLLPLTIKEAIDEEEENMIWSKEEHNMGY